MALRVNRLDYSVPDYVFGVSARLLALRRLFECFRTSQDGPGFACAAEISMLVRCSAVRIIDAAVARQSALDLMRSGSPT